MNNQPTNYLPRPKIVSIIGILQIIFAVIFIAATIYSAHQELKNYQSIIPKISFPIFIGLIIIIVAIAFLKGYQWGRIVLTIFMVTAMIDGVFGVLTNNAPVISGFKLIIQGIIFFILIFNKDINSYFKIAKQIRMEN